jgi:hypothetical protein
MVGSRESASLKFGSNLKRIKQAIVKWAYEKRVKYENDLT